MNKKTRGTPSRHSSPPSSAGRRGKAAQSDHARPPASRGQRSEFSRRNQHDSSPLLNEKAPHNHPAEPVPPSPLSEGGGAETPLLLGLKPVLEMLETAPERIDAVFIRKGRHGKDMDTVIDLCRKGKVRYSLLEATVFSRQMGTTQNQGIVARLFEAGFVEVDTLLASVMDAPLPLIVALDQVQDPGNAGTLARTLYALGGAGLIIPRHNSVYLGAGATRAAAGALQKLPVARAGSLSQAIDSASKQGITIYGAAADNKGLSVPVEDIFHMVPRLPALLILGSEESGIRQTLAKRCTALISIPMQRSFDSLNVAQAGAICIAAFLQRFLDKC